jgi:hypothetical protein
MPVLNKAGFNLNYREFAEKGSNSPSFAWGPESSSGVRIIDVAWGDSQIAQQLFLGWEQVVNDPVTGVNYISRTIPEKMPGYPQLVCREIVRTEAIGKPGIDQNDLGTADTFRMHVKYQSVLWNVLADDDVIGPGFIPDESLLKRNIVPMGNDEGQFITVPFGSLQFSDGVLVMNNGQGGIPRFDPREGFEIQWVDVPTLPQNQHRALLGTINNDTFFGYPPQTLLYAGRVYTISPPSIFGNFRYQIRYRWQFWPKIALDGTFKGHNWLLRIFRPPAVLAGQLDYDLPQASFPGGNTMYQLGDHTKLFFPD